MKRHYFHIAQHPNYNGRYYFYDKYMTGEHEYLIVEGSSAWRASAILFSRLGLFVTGIGKHQ